MLPVVFVLFAASCTKDPETEKPFLDDPTPAPEKKQNLLWEWAAAYPGPVSPEVERAEGCQVQVRGGYSRLIISPSTPVLQSTGLFVPMEDSIEIVVPSGVNKLHYQIGLGHKLETGQIMLRYGNCVEHGLLEAGKTQKLLSWIGGFLYFYYEPGDVPASTDPVTITVNGAIKSDDYIMGSTEQEEADWMKRMNTRANYVTLHKADPGVTSASMPFLMWTELRSPKVILTMGIPEMVAMSKPSDVLSNLENIVDSYMWFGAYDQQNQPPLRVHTDLQVPDNRQRIGSELTWYEEINKFYYPGYPITCVRAPGVDASARDAKRVITIDLLQCKNNITGDNFGNWYALLRGFGETFLGPWAKSPYLLTSTRDMGFYHYARTLNNWPGGVLDFDPLVEKLNANPPKAINYNNSLITMYEANLVRSYDDDKNADETIRSAATTKLNMRVTMLMQIVSHVGWGVFPYMSERCRELNYTNTWNQGSHDLFVMLVSEYAGENMAPFFDAWHFPYTQAAYDYIKQFPAITPDADGLMFWKHRTETLDYLKTAVAEKNPLEKRIPARTVPFPAVRATGIDSILMDPTQGWEASCIHYLPIDGTYITKWIQIDYYNDNHRVSPDNPFNDCVSEEAYARRGYTKFGGHNVGSTIRTRLTTVGDAAYIGATIPAELTSFLDTSGRVNRFEIITGHNPITFNALQWEWGQSGANMQGYKIWDIEYQNTAGEWVRTNPSEMRLLFAAVDDDVRLNWYYFKETYTTNKFRFCITGNLPAVIGPGGGGREIRVRRVGFGQVHTAPW